MGLGESSGGTRKPSVGWSDTAPEANFPRLGYPCIDSSPRPSGRPLFAIRNPQEAAPEKAQNQQDVPHSIRGNSAACGLQERRLAC